MSHPIKKSKGDKALREYMKTAPVREHTLEEISAIMGVTRERVRQIEASALKKIRWHMALLLKNDNLSTREVIRFISSDPEPEHSLTR